MEGLFGRRSNMNIGNGRYGGFQGGKTRERNILPLSHLKKKGKQDLHPWTLDHEKKRRESRCCCFRRGTKSEIRADLVEIEAGS